MAIQLESQALFADYFEQETPDSETSGSETGPSPAQSMSLEYDELMSTSSLQAWMIVIACVFAVLGASGVIGGLYAVRSQVNLEASEILVSRIAQHNPEAKMAAGMLAAQVELSPYVYSVLGFRILIGFLCFAVAGAIKTRASNANNLAVLALAMILFYNVLLFCLTYMTTNAAFDMPGLNSQIVEAAGAVALGIAAGFMLFKIGIYCGLSYYLTQPNISAYFAPKR